MAYSFKLITGTKHISNFKQCPWAILVKAVIWYLQTGPSSLRLSNAHAPVVPRVAQSCQKNKGYI